MWPWQSGGANQENPSAAPSNSAGSQQSNNAGHPQGPELQDMLQMLDHHSNAAPYEEELNMFNSTYIE